MLVDTLHEEWKVTSHLGRLTDDDGRIDELSNLAVHGRFEAGPQAGLR